MQNIIKIILLSIIQGFTEWLPVSSSGHLVIFQKLLNFPVSIGFDLALHLGTVLAALIYFRKDIIRIFMKERKILGYIILALIPTAIIGLAFNSIIEEVFSSLLIVGLGLLITGTLLFISSQFEPRGSLNGKNTFLCGIFQGLSVIPGFSRSGFTISSLIFGKVSREKAARFSFILAIPAILGASLLKIGEMAVLDLGEIVIGIVFSTLIGYLAIGLMMKLLLHKRFKWFAWWCWGVGGLVLLSLIF